MTGVMADMVGRTGRISVGIAREVGGMALIFKRAVSALLAGRMDSDELWRSMMSFGPASLGVMIATAAFTGMILVLQGAIYVDQYGIQNFVGWYVGLATFREVGPILAGLMFSGRVGANNTSELATMKVTEQIDALRILAIDVDEMLVSPRTVSMVVSLAVLVMFGDLVSILAGAASASILLDIDATLFFNSLAEGLHITDFLVGVYKALVFGAVIAVISIHFGLSARGGASGVGRAVNHQVVACAVALFIADYFITTLLR